jgi:hypothetical protein
MLPAQLPFICRQAPALDMQVFTCILSSHPSESDGR